MCVVCYKRISDFSPSLNGQFVDCILSVGGFVISMCGALFFSVSLLAAAAAVCVCVVCYKRISDFSLSLFEEDQWPISLGDRVLSEERGSCIVSLFLSLSLSLSVLAAAECVSLTNEHPRQKDSPNEITHIFFITQTDRHDKRERENHLSIHRKPPSNPSHVFHYLCIPQPLKPIIHIVYCV